MHRTPIRVIAHGSWRPHDAPQPEQAHGGVRGSRTRRRRVGPSCAARPAGSICRPTFPSGPNTTTNRPPTSRTRTSTRRFRANDGSGSARPMALALARQSCRMTSTRFVIFSTSETPTGNSKRRSGGEGRSTAGTRSRTRLPSANARLVRASFDRSRRLSGQPAYGRPPERRNARR